MRIGRILAVLIILASIGGLAEKEYVPAAVFLVGRLIGLVASAKPGWGVLVGTFVLGGLLIDDEVL